MERITGILSALVTPFTEQGQLDTRVMRSLVRWQLECGLAGFFVCGGTGEGLLLDPDERKLSLETVLDEAGTGVPVVAHVGAVATHVAADLAAHAQSAGAAAIAAIPPIYFRVDQPALIAHYQQIADAAPDTPLWLYNIPGATGVTVTVDMFRELMQIPQVAGIKFTSYDFFTMRSIIELGEERGITVLSGPDEMCLPALTMGAHGAIGTTYNILPGLFSQLFECYQAGDLAGAQAKQYQANRIIRAFTSVPSIAAVKAILTRMGFPCGAPRAPMRPLSEAELAKLWQGLDAADFLAAADKGWA